MKKYLILIFCLISVLLTNYSLKTPLSHSGLNDRPTEYERGIFLIVLASESLENWLGDQSNGDDFIEFKMSQGFDVDVI